MNVPHTRFSSLARVSLFFFSLLIGSLALITSPAFGATTISQGYAASTPLASGTIVGLVNGSTDQVEATSTSNSGNMLGVVIDQDTSLLSVSNGTNNQVQVATSGTEPVLVSDINGTVSQGDPITASPINGVGMKATANAKIIGVAQGPVVGTSTESYKDSSGATKQTMIGQAPVLVNVSYYYKQAAKTIIPPALQDIANTIAGKTVSPLPIILSGAIFLITLIVVTVIIYSMIRSSIISVGRNPMAQSAIYRDIIQLSALVLGILLVAMIAIYLILMKL